MDRKTICAAQAAICREQASRNDTDQAFWLAEAQRWDGLAGEHAHAAISFDMIVNASRAPDREAPK